MALLYEKEGRIAIITFNRPEAMNSLDPETIEELTQAWTDFRDDPDVWVAIITGKGDRAFCAGADLKKLIPLMTATARESGSKGFGSATMSSPALLKGFDIWKPIIAAINGHCLAGGTEMIQGMDIRIASENATFGLAEPTWGLFPAGGSTVRLARQIPYCFAMEILLTGNRISAHDALRMGLVNKVVPLPELMPTAREYAERICRNGPLAVRAIKESVIRTLDMSMEDAYRFEMGSAAKVFASEDAIEGPRAFMEKREPDFKGK